MSHLPTTNAGVRYMQQLDYEDGSPDTQIWQIEMKFDGPSPAGLTEVRFAGNATASEKQAAVRLIVNNHLAGYEPGVTLANAKIQISGQPV